MLSLETAIAYLGDKQLVKTRLSMIKLVGLLP